MKKPHHKAKPIYQYTVNGYFVKQHESTATAALSLGISRETISLVLRGINKTGGGYQFSFEKHDQIEPLSYTRNRMINIRELVEKRCKDISFQDLGIISNPESREYGKRKIRIKGMEIYAHPDKDVNEIVEKFSRAI